MKYMLTLIAALLIAGCSYEDMKEAIVPKEESSFAKAYLDELRLKNYAYVTSKMHPELLAKVTNAGLDEVSSYFPQGEPQSTELMGSNVRVFNGVWSANFSFESEFNDGWSVSNISMVKEGDKTLVTSIKVYRTAESQKVVNSFLNADLNATKLLILVLTLVIPIFMIVTCVAVYRAPIEKKWRWYLFSFVGVGAITMNWTTGEIGTRYALIKLLGGASTASEFAPFIFSFTIPIGAIAFWLKRKKLIQLMANKASKQDAV
jgi:hypothetical protein